MMLNFLGGCQNPGEFTVGFRGIYSFVGFSGICETKTFHGIQASSVKWQDPSNVLEFNISPTKALFEDEFPFPQVGYVNSLDGNPYKP